jgi:tRNA threonylcarbamoyladenosine biosynthesis protein TsaB
MSYILNIDTALETASICLAKEEEVLGYAENKNQKDHSQWLHVTIEQLLNEQKITAVDLEAIAVCTGPGSYTGLRVGLSTAKGLCYALNKPLITINNLLLTAAVQSVANSIICPCIDARRMEVYFGLFNKDLNEIKKPSSLILIPDSFNDILEKGPVLFCGNGVHKIQSCIQHANAVFSQTLPTAKDMVNLSLEKINTKHFDDLVTAEPLYIKPFYTTMQGI